MLRSRCSRARWAARAEAARSTAEEVAAGELRIGEHSPNFMGDRPEGSLQAMKSARGDGCQAWEFRVQQGDRHRAPRAKHRRILQEGIGGRPSYMTCVMAAFVAYASRVTGTGAPPPMQGDAEQRYTDRATCTRRSSLT